MSYTSVYELFKTKVNCIGEFHNGHGSGPAVWDYISLKVLGKKFDMFNDKEFWGCYESEKLDDFERAVLMSTYDRAFIEVNKLPEFAKACRKIHKLIIDNTSWEWNHFESIGDSADKLFKNHDHRCRGLAIGCTSVSDAWEQEDISDIKAWGVYGEIENMLKEQSK